MVSSFVYGIILLSFFIGYVFTMYPGADNAISVNGENLSFVLSRQPSVTTFPYFFFITGVFYGFVVGVIFTGYLTWQYILKPNRSTKSNRSRHVSTSPARPRRTYANAVVQGPVTYNPQKGKKREYDPLAEKYWGAWWY